ncbi:MAG: putative Ig domain-containing protein [Gammaproteobacteria bacterium]|nr:putative Ig domain-containing protein [Gammaproteobacteria bacterium]
MRLERKGICVVFVLFFMLSIAGCRLNDGPSGFDGIPKHIGGTDSGSDGAPTISGSPDSAVLVGDTYSFNPSASDPNDDALTFAIRNQPRWASFDATTGRLSGAVSLGDVGVYDGIRISVSAGGATKSLPDFSITVTDTALGSITLSWAAPTQNADGTPLLDLAGYNLYYGQSESDYSKQVRISNPSVTTYMLENLLPGTYYVVATSFNAQGVESDYSNPAVKNVSFN